MDDFRKMMDKHFGDMDKRMEEMFNSIQKNRGGFFGNGLFSHMGSGCSWIERDKKKVLPLNFGPVKDSPLEVDVKDNQITIKGQAKKEEKAAWGDSVSISSLHLSCPIPEDVDPDSIKVEVADNKYQIEMDKRKKNNAYSKKESHRPQDKGTALPPSADDISI
ncbi:MAG: Hsp20/alpha crystallin family protein [Halobacteriovoraceae bacterium]|nr:Hsp20/alpha crystallin family protein [Halobacteriovoraceae bacterium]